jgi:hypothetical protein
VDLAGFVTLLTWAGLPAGRDIRAAGAARFVGAGFFFSCCAPLAANASARLQNNAKSILIVFSFLPSSLLDS